MLAIRRGRAALIAALATAMLPLTAVTAQANTAVPAAAPAAALAYAGSCPAAGRVSQGFHGGHEGVDIANVKGTPIYAVGPGTVIHSGAASGYGQSIRIRHDDGTVTEYGHMYSRLVGANVRVSGGQKIALMGSEGQSTGPHLHFEVQPNTSTRTGIDPIRYLADRGVSLPCTPGGGGGQTNFTTWGTGVRVRAEARLNASVVRTLAGPTAVRVTCQKRGDLVRAEGYENDAWSYLPDFGGYISNIYIDHSAAWLPGVRTC
ncbi:M23 family metallopeptidase [Streptomyces sp. TRM 70351]|uniref:M23 family metallopeptidase n=1 Tax=Streptomyces sp. TRM 70351 TaxID=3116552 RepID=UPI002E7C44A0|nr:M23 family metallopeptidase [Streptomyces sp. TRM 70351]MEE1927522.1 M23 family metallopeptidase [Streptomyces sp. TRM 70351]